MSIFAENQQTESSSLTWVSERKKNGSVKP